MQRTWQSELSWDVPLPNDIHEEWTAFVDDLPLFLQTQIPRYNVSAYMLMHIKTNLVIYLGFETRRIVDTRQWLTYVSLKTQVTNLFFNR